MSFRWYRLSVAEVQVLLREQEHHHGQVMGHSPQLGSKGCCRMSGWGRCDTYVAAREGITMAWYSFSLNPVQSIQGSKKTVHGPYLSLVVRKNFMVAFGFGVFQAGYLDHQSCVDLQRNFQLTFVYILRGAGSGFLCKLFYENFSSCQGRSLISILCSLSWCVDTGCQQGEAYHRIREH